MKDFARFIIRVDKISTQKLFGLHPRSAKLTKFIVTITRGYGLLPVILAVFFLSRNIPLTLLWLVVILVASAVVVETGIKNLVKRERPAFLGRKFNSYSFPSTHSAAMTMCFLHLLTNPGLYSYREALLLLIGIWGVFTITSRIIYGYHYVLDTFFGIVIGALIYLPLQFLFAA